jgi:phosphoribosylaminoimidazole carboxylase (NCAIR synthetase)
MNRRERKPERLSSCLSKRATIGVIGTRHDLPCQLRLAARNLRVDLYPLDAPAAQYEADNFAPRYLQSDQTIEELLARAAICDVVTFDQHTVNASQLDAITSVGIALRPNRHALLLSHDPYKTAQALRDFGFDVAMPMSSASPFVSPRIGGSPHYGAPIFDCASDGGDLTVSVVRRPSGHLVAHTANSNSERSERSRAVNVAVSIANGLDIAGALTVSFLFAAGQPQILDISLGPSRQHCNLSAVSHFENHLRALLDWPLMPPGNSGVRRCSGRLLRAGQSS